MVCSPITSCHTSTGAWAVNMVLHTTPYYTMKRLFKQAKEPKYADAENQLKALGEGTYGAGSWEKDYPNGIWDPSYLEAQKATGIN